MKGPLIVAILSLGLVIPSLGVINNPTKQAKAYCFSDGKTLSTHFALNENTDPAGTLIETLMGNYMRVPNNDCQYTRVGINNTVVYLDVKIALTGNGDTENQGCFRLESFDRIGNYSEFILAHQAVRNGYDEVLLDWDRIYKWRCYRNMPVNLNLSSAIEVRNLGLSAPLTPSAFPVVLSVWKKIGTDALVNDIFEKINPAVTVTAGTIIRFQLSLDIGNSYIDFVDAFGIKAYDLIVMYDQNRNRRDLLIGLRGCSVASPFKLDRGFKFSSVLSNPQRYVMITGNTFIFGYDSRGSSITYMVSYIPCFDTTQRDACEDMCLDQTGTRERKRRSDREEDFYTTQVTLTVATETETKPVSDTVIIAATVSATVVVVLILAAVTCCLVVYFRKRREQTDQNKLQLPTF